MFVQTQELRIPPGTQSASKSCRGSCGPWGSGPGTDTIPQTLRVRTGLEYPGGFGVHQGHATTPPGAGPSSSAPLPPLPAPHQDSPSRPPAQLPLFSPPRCPRGRGCPRRLGHAGSCSPGRGAAGAIGSWNTQFVLQLRPGRGGAGPTREERRHRSPEPRAPEPPSPLPRSCPGPATP